MDSFYTLDANDCIDETGGWWDQFADTNNGAASRSDMVLGKQLWGFIEGKDTVSYLDAIFRDCRRMTRSACLPYRCDSPDRPRLFQMIVDPMPSGKLVVRHRFISRFIPVVAGLDGGLHSDPIETYCRVCHSVPVGHLRIDPANMSGAPDPHDGVPFCPNCRDVAALVGE